ncbi:MAG: hypothetical protein PF487_08965 [Bacteroidales bacterium]|jgi:uncharacterized protein affecting Mg2+/Co2+ transport|nr:hypothetical protein [Bacteroidales bacterium]
MSFKNFKIVEQGNKFVIVENGDQRALFSYDSLIAVKDLDSGEVTLNERYWNFSSTTGKHRNNFLGEGLAETRKKIKSGEYIVEDLD